MDVSVDVIVVVVISVSIKACAQEISLNLVHFIIHLKIFLAV